MCSCHCVSKLAVTFCQGSLEGCSIGCVGVSLCQQLCPQKAVQLDGFGKLEPCRWFHMAWEINGGHVAPLGLLMFQGMK